MNNQKSQSFILKNPKDLNIKNLLNRIKGKTLMKKQGKMKVKTSI